MNRKVVQKVAGEGTRYAIGMRISLEVGLFDFGSWSYLYCCLKRYTGTQLAIYLEISYEKSKCPVTYTLHRSTKRNKTFLF